MSRPRWHITTEPLYLQLNYAKTFCSAHTMITPLTLSAHMISISTNISLWKRASHIFNGIDRRLVAPWEDAVLEKKFSRINWASQ
jgi:hypothetical protein